MLTKDEEIENTTIITALQQVDLNDLALEDIAEMICDLNFFVIQTGVCEDGSPHYQSYYDRKSNKLILSAYLYNNAYVNQNDVNFVRQQKVNFLDLYMNLKEYSDEKIVVHFNFGLGKNVFQASFQLIELVYLMDFSEIEYSDDYFVNTSIEKEDIKNIFTKYDINPAVIEMTDTVIQSKSLIIIVDKDSDSDNNSNIVSDLTHLDPDLESILIVPMSEDIQVFLDENQLALKYLN